MNKSISCYLISETSLGLQCATELIKEGHKLLGIISTHHETCRWAHQNNIPIIPSLLDFQKLNPYKKFDYLFSIVNSQILTASVLQLPRFCAINYHDSPLPKYAGVHATSWALLNNEKTHGISWHKMDEIVDKGSILKQPIFPIREDETALSLNLECYIRGLESFKDLIKDLAQDNIPLEIEQNIRNRSYFARHQKPSNLGFISWSSSAEDIERQFRSLYFGEYSNTFTTFKVLIGNQIFIPTELKILNTQSEDNAGTVINITDEKIQISTKTQDITLANFKTTKGQPITIQKIKQSSWLSLGYRLQNLTIKITKELHKLSNDLSPCEIFWTRSILNSSPATLPFAHQSPKIDEAKTKKKKHKKIIISNEKFLLYSSRYHDIVGNNYSITEVLLTTFIIYLNRIGNASPFSVGFVNSFLQDLPNTFQLFFPRYVPLTCSVLPSMTISDLMSHIQDQVIATKKNKAYFNDLLIRFPNLGSSFAELPIIIKIEEKLQTENEKDDKEKEDTRFDDATFVFSIDQINKTCVLEIEEFLIEDYLNDTVIALINYLPEHLEMLVKQIIENPDKTVDQLSLLSSQEQRQLLIEWNDTKTDYPEAKDKTIAELFEEQVTRSPNNIAVVYEDQELTYKQLNEKANQLGSYLRTIGVGPDTLVAIAVERSLEMIIGLLGILKAGGAYVPLDPDYPEERLQFMLQDTEAPVLITQGHLQEQLKETLTSYRGMTVIIDQLGSSLSQQSIENPLSFTLPHHLAYVIYTSGSTGKPKGVENTHYGLLNRLSWTLDNYPLSEQDVFLHIASLGFDISIWEMIFPLFGGASLVITREKENKDILCLISVINTHKVTIVHFVPSLLNLFINSKKGCNCKSLTQVITGGEALPNEVKHQFLSSFKDTNFYLAYGPSEAAISVTHWNCRERGYIDKTSIGRPISNTQIYILDSCMNPVPIGIAGRST
jgi:amino acid adenylation domain-containing protein